MITYSVDQRIGQSCRHGYQCCGLAGDCCRTRLDCPSWDTGTLTCGSLMDSHSGGGARNSTLDSYWRILCETGFNQGVCRYRAPDTRQGCNQGELR